MKKQMIAAMSAATIALGGSAHAVTIAFDIGPAGGLDGDGGLSQTTIASEVWNNFGAIPGNTDFGGVQDTDGNETGFTMQASGIGGRDGSPTLNAGWSGAAPQTVIDSWYFRGPGTMTFVLKGFTPGSAWDVEVINAFNTGIGANAVDIQVNSLFADGTAGPSSMADGDDWRRREDGWDNSTGLTFSGFTADDNGFLTVTVGGANPTVQAIVLTSVPEPSSTALISLSGIALILRRRRK